MFYLYVLRCRDGSLYTGYTSDMGKRIAAHNKGSASKYTRSRRPVKLVYQKPYRTKSGAMRAEAVFKRLSRKEKLKNLSANRKN